MKTTTLIIALVFTFITQFLFSNNVNPQLEDENYINDIPFNTEEIASDILGVSNIPPSVFILDDEEYIDDIPFNTVEIVSNIKNNFVSSDFSLEEERYITDIPFDTQEIYYNQFVLQQKNEYENEASINDIPFDTEEIAMNSYWSDFAFENEEKYIDDIPFDTYKVSTNSIEYYEIILSNMSNEIQSMFDKCYCEKIGKFTQNIIKNVMISVENNSIEILNSSINIMLP